MNAKRFLALAAMIISVLTVTACGSTPSSPGAPTAPPVHDSSTSPLAGATRSPAATPVEVPQSTCEVTPSQTEGPYYFNAGQVRRNITEGKPGTPLLVALHLVEAGSCAPVRGAVVDIWHADAAGRYSGYRGQGDDGADTSGQTFLRGLQTTDGNGLVEFKTIYPGSYPGRAVHIHFKAYTEERRLVTSQMYFPDDVTDTVYTAEPYSARGLHRTTNERDRIFNGDTSNRALLGRVTQDGEGYLVSLTIGVEH